MLLHESVLYQISYTSNVFDEVGLLKEPRMINTYLIRRCQEKIAFVVGCRFIRAGLARKILLFAPSPSRQHGLFWGNFTKSTTACRSRNIHRSCSYYCCIFYSFLFLFMLREVWNENGSILTRKWLHAIVGTSGTLFRQS